MPKELIEVENDVQLWWITHDTADVEGFIVKDPRRTPADWGFGTGQKEAAMAKFRERVIYAETHPPLR